MLKNPEFNIIYLKNVPNSVFSVGKRFGKIKSIISSAWERVGKKCISKCFLKSSLLEVIGVDLKKRKEIMRRS